MAKPARFYFSVYKSLILTLFQLMKGIWKINRLTGPIVSIFGGTKIQSSSIYARNAHDLAYLLVQHDISVITGGGPGIMEAANCGAFHGAKPDSKARSIGITVKGLEKEPFNMCAQEKLIVDYFFVRKWLLVQYSVAFAFFPGGFGTLDELGEVITLIQTKKIPGVPIILIGSEYWQPYVEWLRTFALKEKLIKQSDLDLIKITDDIHEAYDLLKAQCDECK